MKPSAFTVVFFALAALLSFAARLLPHLPNFTPLGALFLASGAWAGRRSGFFLPLLAMLASDWRLGFYHPGVMISVYAGFLLYFFLGRVLGSKGLGHFASGAALGAGLFFLITNFAVWVFTSWYSKDAAGLLLAYALALPFFKNMLLADVLYSGLFYAAYKLVGARLYNALAALNPKRAALSGNIQAG